jgi:hypothetical protein
MAWSWTWDLCELQQTLPHRHPLPVSRSNAGMMFFMLPSNNMDIVHTDGACMHMCA